MKRPSTFNWWFAAAYNITAIVGLGVLALPNAMVFLSWYGAKFFTKLCSMYIWIYFPPMLEGDRATGQHDVLDTEKKPS